MTMKRSRLDSDIRVYVSFFGHAKRKKLQRRAGHEGVVCLFELWAWASVHRPNGDLTGLSNEDIALSTTWSGDHDKFITALHDSELLDGSENNWIIHDYEEEQPHIQNRKIAQELGKIGGLKAAANMTPEQKIERARHAAESRGYAKATKQSSKGGLDDLSETSKGASKPCPVLSCPVLTDPLLALPNSVPVLPSVNVLCPDKQEQEDRISNTSYSHSKAGGLSSNDAPEKKEFALFGEPYEYGKTDLVPDNPSEQPATETHGRTKTQKEVPRSDLDPLCDKSTTAVAKVAKKGKSGPSTADSEEVFEYWKQVMNHPGARMGKKREPKIVWALENYGLDRCKVAINGCASCPHNMGQNDNNMEYNDIELIFRNESNFERFEAAGKKARIALDSNTGTVSVRVEGGKQKETQEERIARFVGYIQPIADRAKQEVEK